MTVSDKQAIRSIVQDVLAEIDLVALRDCQEKLQEALEQNRRLEQNFKLYHELAERRGEQSEALKLEVEALKTEIALLTSAVQNLNHEQR